MNNRKKTDQELEVEITQLSSEITPTKDLWVGVERAIAHQAQERSSSIFKRKTHLAWAASVIAAILLTWGALYPQTQIKQAPSNLALMMEQNFEKNKQLILTSYGQSSSKGLSSEAQKQLKELALARTAINKALKADPYNSDLLNLLRWTQQQELDFLQQIYSPQWQTI
ncbi:hypothetical protein [Thalassotalea profundi]|uniref:DUF3379 domain-containing protein n=1 Tax=Thalassotalea profundi TaxID=2036687 RepID=A0ABQ3IUA3_9GAMM|nr:hypothetical protein [Thalassotalea profundi]GHE94003.1 hypothetical protein GCM10011501_24330 [Thalassotalea profundi]